jgi:hypothetical protein
VLVHLSHDLSRRSKKLCLCFLFEVLNDEVPKTFFDLPPAKANSGGKRRLSRERQQGEARAERRAAPLKAKASRGGVPDTHAPQGPALVQTLDPVDRPLPSLTPEPPPPLPFITTIPPGSGLRHLEFTDWFLEVPDPPVARRRCARLWRKVYGKEWRADCWEVVDNRFGADPGADEEMAVDDLLGHVGDSVPSPSPPFSPDWSSGKQDVYRHWVD